MGACNPYSGQLRWQVVLGLALTCLSRHAAANEASLAARPRAHEPPLAFALGKASDCATCHAFPNPSGREDENPHAPYAWQTSMMGLSARDPVFWAGVAIARQDAPEQATLCVRCHVPRAYWEGRLDIKQANDLQAADREGVSCDVCHRMELAADAIPGNANYDLNDTAGDNGVSPPKLGPWRYEAGENLMHEWRDDISLLADSRACGACHDVTTERPRLDDKGQELGHRFNEQRTYSEWRNSAFADGGSMAQSCQDCHMPKLSDVAGCKDFLMDGRTHATGGRAHTLAGANRFVVSLMRDLLGSAGEDILPDRYFDASIAAIDATLAQAATLEIKAPAVHSSTAKPLELPLVVTNKSGHKLPTGYSEGRVMWLQTIVRYRNNVVFSSGLVNEDNALVDDPQQRRYEAIAHDADNGERFHLLRNNQWLIDSRLPPLGLVADPQTDPVGDRYQLQADGTWPHADAFAYTIDLQALVDATPDQSDDDELKVEARLLYQINTPQYVEFLAKTNQTNDAGTTVRELFNARGGAAPMEVARAEATIMLRAFADPNATTPDTSEETSDTSPSTDPNESDDEDPAPAAKGCGCAAPTDSGALTLACLFLALAGAVSRPRRRQS